VIQDQGSICLIGPKSAKYLRIYLRVFKNILNFEFKKKKKSISFTTESGVASCCGLTWQPFTCSPPPTGMGRKMDKK